MIGLSSNGVVYFKFASVEGRLWKGDKGFRLG